MKENSDDVIGIQDEEEEINSGEQWKKTPYLKINSMDYNQNNTLLVLSTNYGYRIFDVLNDFKLVSVVDENQKELGPLKKTKILYKSSLLGFIGMRENERFKENTFNFYSDEYKKFYRKFRLIKILKISIFHQVFYLFVLYLIFMYSNYTQ